MIAVCSPDAADNIIQALRNEGEKPVRLGSVVTHRDGARVAHAGSLKL
jgi:phosphoribosylformylglycinamidine cyclo-ligase